MSNRREFLTQSILGAGALSFVSPKLFADSAASKPPTRFIFIHKGNGLHPDSLVPPSFSEKQLEAEKRKDSFAVDLDGHDLPEWMSPIAGHRNNLTILQGL